MTARHHHYLSQCYLRGFTQGDSKKSRFVVLDLQNKRHFETKPRNVGGLRDFNRIDVKGVDQNILEESLASFEGVSATALRKIGEGQALVGDLRNHVLNLIALFAVRSPEKREQWRTFQAQVAEQVMGLTLASRERWESQIKQLKDIGKEVNENVSYEDVLSFFERKEYRIEVAREHHIQMEFAGIDVVLPLLGQRNWLVVKSSEQSGPFITSDNPVVLTWSEPRRVPPLYRHSPGFGMNNTQVYFPLSRDTALIGEFNGPEGVVEATERLVAVLNSKLMYFAYKHLFAPTLRFQYIGKDGKSLDGFHLLRNLGSQ